MEGAAVSRDIAMACKSLYAKLPQPGVILSDCLMHFQWHLRRSKLVPANKADHMCQSMETNVMSVMNVRSFIDVTKPGNLTPILQLPANICAHACMHQMQFVNISAEEHVKPNNMQDKHLSVNVSPARTARQHNACRFL